MVLDLLNDIPVIIAHHHELKKVIMEHGFSDLQKKFNAVFASKTDYGTVFSAYNSLVFLYNALTDYVEKRHIEVEYYDSINQFHRVKKQKTKEEAKSVSLVAFILALCMQVIVEIKKQKQHGYRLEKDTDDAFFFDEEEDYSGKYADDEE